MDEARQSGGENKLRERAGAPASPRPRGRLGRWPALLLTCAVLALAGPMVYPRQSPPPAVDPTSVDHDARHRTLVVGTWEDDYKGKRTMTLRQDGTGTMLVELDGLHALFASRLRFDMEWVVQDGRLKKRTVGGEPAGRVKAILAMLGDRVDEPILELTEDRLLLLDADGQTRYDWRRVE